METSRYRIAILAVVVAVAVIAGSRLSPEKKPAPGADAAAYVDAAVVAICTDWNRDRLIDRASPELAAALQSTDPKEYFVELSSVGPLKKYEGATGEAKTVVYNGNAKTTADYTARAEFERGPATINISLVKFNEGDWQIAQFQVHPDSPLPRKTP